MDKYFAYKFSELHEIFVYEIAPGGGIMVCYIPKF